MHSFFILSGFLITASYERSSSLYSFLKKRVARIYPAFLAMSCFVALVVVPLGGGVLKGSDVSRKVIFVLLDALRLKDLHATGVFAHSAVPGALNASLWTVSYEFLCYLGIALLGVTTLLRRRAVLVCLFVASLACGWLVLRLQIVASKTWVSVLLGYPQAWASLLPMYLAGAVAYRLRHRIKITWPGVLVSSMFLVISVRIPSTYLVLFPFAGTYLLLAFSFSERLARFTKVSWGDISYGTYLYAFPVQQLTYQYCGPRVTPARITLISLPITFILAWLSWFFVEHPTLRLLRRSEQVSSTPVVLKPSRLKA